MWFVRRSKYEAERRARIKAESALKHCADNLAMSKTARSRLLHENKLLRDRLAGKSGEEPLSPPLADIPFEEEGQ